MKGKLKKNDTNSTKQLNEVIRILKDLHEAYPHQGICRHIMDATTDYPNLWIMDNKELAFALDKYKLELEMNIESQEGVDQIIADAEDITHIFKDEDIIQDREPGIDDDYFDVDKQNWL